MKYTIVFEKAPNNYCAFSPDIPGCISVADTPEEMRLMIREAIEFHFECSELDGDPIPEPSAWVEMLELVPGRNYIAVYEKEREGYSAYIPDLLPDCEVIGTTAEEVQQNFLNALTGYLKVLESRGESLPEPSSWAETMEIPHPSEVPA